MPEEDFGIPSWKVDFALKDKAELFLFGSENMNFYLHMNGMERCIAEKNIHDSNALPNWLWDHDIIWNDTLFQVIKKLSGMMHNPWNHAIPWNDIFLLMAFEISSVWHDHLDP